MTQPTTTTTPTPATEKQIAYAAKLCPIAIAALTQAIDNALDLRAPIAIRLLTSLSKRQLSKQHMSIYIDMLVACTDPYASALSMLYTCLDAPATKQMCGKIIHKIIQNMLAEAEAAQAAEVSASEAPATVEVALDTSPAGIVAAIAANQRAQEVAFAAIAAADVRLEDIPFQPSGWQKIILAACDAADAAITAYQAADEHCYAVCSAAGKSVSRPCADDIAAMHRRVQRARDLASR